MDGQTAAPLERIGLNRDKSLFGRSVLLQSLQQLLRQWSVCVGVCASVCVCQCVYTCGAALPVASLPLRWLSGGCRLIVNMKPANKFCSVKLWARILDVVLLVVGSAPVLFLYLFDSIGFLRSVVFGRPFSHDVIFLLLWFFSHTYINIYFTFFGCSTLEDR